MWQLGRVPSDGTSRVHDTPGAVPLAKGGDRARATRARRAACSSAKSLLRSHVQRAVACASAGSCRVVYSLLAKRSERLDVQQDLVSRRRVRFGPGLAARQRVADMHF